MWLPFCVENSSERFNHPIGLEVKKQMKQTDSTVGKVRMFTDGASRGNPGPAGAGVLIQDEWDRPIKSIRRYLGRTTNNVAEYSALIEGLIAVQEFQPSLIEVFSDSELMIKQMRGEYRVRNANLLLLHQRAKDLMRHLNQIRFYAIPREMNKAADALANEAIDQESARVPKSIR